MRLKSEPMYLEKRTQVPWSISFYSIVYLVVKRMLVVDYFGLMLGIIFGIDLNLVVALVMFIIAKIFYNKLIIETLKRFQMRKEVFRYIKGYDKEVVSPRKTKDKTFIPFSKN